MFMKIACRTSIFLVEETADPLFAAGGTTMKDMAPTATNLLYVWCWLKKCIYG